MKIIYRILVFLVLSLVVYSCGKDDLDFKSFLNEKEIIYPGRMAKVAVLPGKNRVGFAFNPSPDPSVAKYIVYWNNKKDSLVVQATSHNPEDTVKVIVPGLDEYTYSFTIYSLDSKGNRSIPLEINNVKVYGSIYQSLLVNRLYNPQKPYVINEDGTLTLNFGESDTSNVATIIQYTNKLGQTEQKSLKASESSIVLTNYKPETAVQFKSSYVPKKGSIDTFLVNNFEQFPQIDPYIELDKSKFRAVNLKNDAQAWDSGAALEKLWDGSRGPQGWGNVFHTNGGDYMPVHFTFDLGKVYTNVSQMEETGRDCCHNPDQFEVWGIADLTGAETNLRGNESGWKEEMIAKGWTLLKDVVRTDDGKAPLKFKLMDNPPPVRYIRIRVKHNSNNEGWYTNLSEITLWKSL